MEAPKARHNGHAGKVGLHLFRLGGGFGYDLTVYDPWASVGDYLQAMQELAEEADLLKQRNPGGTCPGCSRCCAERIPLTSIDVFSWGEVPGQGKEVDVSHSQGLHQVRQDSGETRGCRTTTAPFGRGKGKPWSIKDITNRYAWIAVCRHVVDITLRRREDGTCLLLDGIQGICQDYAHRPLVCRTYYCCPASRRANLLREAIVNQGEDELVRLLLQEAGGTRNFHLDEGDSPAIQARDWRRNAFSDKDNFDQVLLREICSPRLWQQLSPKSGTPKTQKGRHD